MNGGGFLKNVWVRVVLIFDVLILVALGVLAFQNARKSAVLTFNITPLDSEILVNGGGYHNSSYSFAPGAYEIKITHEGLAPKTLNIELKPGHNLNLATFLKSEDSDFSYYKKKEHYADFLKLEEIASKKNNQTFDADSSAESFIENFRQSYDLLTSALPIEHQEYIGTIDGKELTKDITIKVSHDAECETSLCLKALILGADKNFANSLLKEKGLKVEDYEIYYKVY